MVVCAVCTEVTVGQGYHQGVSFLLLQISLSFTWATCSGKSWGLFGPLNLTN